MRIAVVTSYFPTNVQPYRGHSAYQTIKQMQGDSDIRVFCPLTRYPTWLPPRHFPYSRVDLDYKVKDLEAEYFEYPAIPVASRPFNPKICEHHLRNRLTAFRPDLILNYFVYPEGCAAASIGKSLGIPVVLGVIGSDVNRLPDAVTGWHTRQALRRATGVIAVSDQTRRQAVALGARQQRARTIPNGCDLKIFHLKDRSVARRHLSIASDSELIVFVGWIAATKGVQELLDATAQLAQNRPRLQVAFIGEGALSAQIKLRAKTGVLRNRIFIPGPLPSPEVAEWLAAADLFCLPSYAEGCPNVVIEALASGTPVVASHVGGIPDLVDANSGILTRPRDSGALAEALERALTTNWDHAAIAAKWNRSWSSVARETLAFCSDAVAWGAN